MKRLGCKIRNIAIASSGVAAVFAIMLAAAPVVAKDECSQERDVAGVEKCFLAQFPCVGLYLGIDGAPNYPKALKCYEAHEAWPFTAPMYLNGDGTPRDLRKAQEVIATGEKTYPYELDFEMTPILRKAIDRCKSDVHKSCPRVDYCKDLATRTLDMEICQAIDQLDGETASSRAIGLLKSKLSVGDNVIFDRAVAEFKAYQLAEMGRAYDASIDGTIRGLAGSGQAAFVRENFQQLMAETLQTHKLKPARLDEYKSVDGEIAELYSSNIREPIAGWQESLNGPEEQERGTSTKR